MMKRFRCHGSLDPCRGGEREKTTGLKTRGTISMLVACIVMVASADVFACAVCGGDPQSPIAAGMNMAIVALLGMTGMVLFGFAAFFGFLWRRGVILKRKPVDTEWLEGFKRINS